MTMEAGIKRRSIRLTRLYKGLVISICMTEYVSYLPQFCGVYIDQITDLDLILPRRLLRIEILCVMGIVHHDLV